MHKNTFLLVALLAVFAALVVGVNIGRRTAAPAPETVPTVQASPTVGPTAAPALTRYTNSRCGITLDYPEYLTKLEDATGSAIFVNTQTPDESIVVTCQEEIPRPPLPPEQIETRTIANETGTASISARLYHDTSAEDGTPRDSLIFRHPQTGFDVFLAGFGTTFDKILSSLKLLP